jgi:RsiW-degrading membrane proteinase PrsW (M82 family)
MTDFFLMIYGIIVVIGVPIVLYIYPSSRKYMKFYLGGFGAALMALIIESHVMETYGGYGNLVVFYAPIIEEVAKTFAIIGFSKILVDETRPESGEPHIFYVWLFIGLGFGFGENALYTTYLVGQEDSIYIMLTRTLFPVALHAVTTIVTGYLIEKNLSGRDISHSTAFLYALLLTIPAIVIHYAYNLGLAP